MKKILLIASSLFVFNIHPANACSCVPTTPEQSFKNSRAVFSGRVIDVIEPGSVGESSSGCNPSVSSDSNSKVIFEVSNVWKGTVDQQLVVMTSGSSASCGYSFQEGEEYLVYASGQETELQTGLCNGTKSLANAQADLAALGEGEAPNVQESIAEQLRQNKQLWANQNVVNYRYTLRRNCRCLPEVTQPVVIEVRKRKATSITAANSGNPVNREYFKDYNSVAKLFDVIQDAIAKNADQISVTYHPTLGYPTQISIDYSEQIADEELSFTVENLEIIK